MGGYNPRNANWKARRAVLELVRRRVMDGEPCGICGQPIDLTRPQWTTRADGKRIRAPWSLECDEIIPLARGGSPIDPDNVQPAHRACNVRKGAGRSKTAARAVKGATSREW